MLPSLYKKLGAGLDLRRDGMEQRLMDVFDRLDEEQKDEVITFALSLLETQQRRGVAPDSPPTTDP